MRKKVLLTLDVPKEMSDDRVCELIRKLLDVGIFDAEEILREYVFDDEDSKDVISIDYEDVEVLN